MGAMKTMAVRMILLLLLALSASAQAQTRAWLDRDRIAFGETATLNIETDQATVSAPDYARLAADFIVSGHSSRRSIEVVNGRRQARSLFAVALQPRRRGELLVPALPVGNAMTQPLALTVLPSAAAPATAQSGAEAFIEAEIDTRRAWVQQSIGYVLRLYYPPSLMSGKLDQPPPEGADLQRVGSDVQYTREIDGRAYTVVERRFQIVPERSGTLEIPAAQFSGRTAGGFFGEGRSVLSAEGEPFSVQVRAMPADAPQPWLPLQGLELRYLEAPDSLRVGSAATLVLELHAKGGSGAQLPELQLGRIDGAQVFAEPPQIDETFDGGSLHTRVVRRFQIVPSREGVLLVPGPTQAWWDAGAGRARTASLPDLQFEVAAGSGASGMAALPSAQSAHGRGAGWWPWLALLFALLWLLTLGWALRWHQQARWPWAARVREEDADAARQSSASTTLRMLLDSLQTGDLGEVETVLCGLCSPPVVDLDALLARLDDPAQRASVQQLQQARWGGGDPVAARQALREAFRGSPRFRPTRKQATPPLPPLYP